jgi:hypothetical protein
MPNGSSVPQRVISTTCPAWPYAGFERAAPAPAAGAMWLSLIGIGSSAPKW